LKFVDFLYFFDDQTAVFTSTRRNFWRRVDYAGDSTSTTIRCFFRRRRTLYAYTG